MRLFGYELLVKFQLKKLSARNGNTRRTRLNIAYKTSTRNRIYQDLRCRAGLHFYGPWEERGASGGRRRSTSLFIGKLND